MAFFEKELGVQLKDAGNKLLTPPSSVQDLLSLLDRLEYQLSMVKQSPSELLKTALLPSTKALIAKEILQHSDEDVRVSVASCISQIMRISAPQAPYDEDQMKEYFNLTVVAFGKLSDASSHCYSKAVSILGTAAKIKSCILMLDLNCDALVMEMFRHFLKAIRSNHSHDVFKNMEAIMTTVLEESDDISWELLCPLLESVKKKNQNVSPMSWKLAESVIKNCASKLQPYLVEAVQCTGIVLNGNGQKVASICKNGSDIFEPIKVDGFGEHLTRNVDTSVDEDPMQKLEPCYPSKHSEVTDTKDKNEPDNLDSKNGVKSDIVTEMVPKKRDRRPNSLMNPEEGYDHSWIRRERKVLKKTSCKKYHDLTIDSSASEKPVSLVTAFPSPREKEFQPQVSSPKFADIMTISASPKSPKFRLPDGSYPQESLMNKDAVQNSFLLPKENLSFAQVEHKAPKHTDISLDSESEGTIDMKTKPQRKPRNDAVAVNTNGEITPAPGGVVSEREGGSRKYAIVVKKYVETTPALANVISKRGGSSGKNAIAANTNGETASGAGDVVSKREGQSVHRTVSKKRKRGKTTAEKDIRESGVKKPVFGFTSKSLIEKGNYIDETPKTNSKRRKKEASEMLNGVNNLGEQLIGRRIKVWWPKDKRFYGGVVDSFDGTTKKHRVLYSDGDEERLNLKKECWELIGDEESSDDDEERAKLPSSDA